MEGSNLRLNGAKRSRCDVRQLAVFLELSANSIGEVNLPGDARLRLRRYFEQTNIARTGAPETRICEISLCSR